MMKVALLLAIRLAFLTVFSSAATDFCKEPLGMKRRIILDDQITETSMIWDSSHYKGYNARLDNNMHWCSFTGSDVLKQWVKVDLRYPYSITGISIQGDSHYPPNYIKKFKLRYSVNGKDFLYKVDTTNVQKEFIGATRSDETITRMFETKPFLARYIEFRPIEFNGKDACVRFELYGCNYACSSGIGIEHGNLMPSGFVVTSSTSVAGQGPTSARLSGPSCWCAVTADQNQYLQVDFGRIMMITGIAVQGNPTANSWVKDFYLDYGMATDSLVTYTEAGVNKLFVGNVDKITKVINWFKTRLFSRHVKIRPNTWDLKICTRVEIMGCDSEVLYELGAENRALADSRFTASAFSSFVPGRYEAHDGRLNNLFPWGLSKSAANNPWFKIDLGRVMVVNGISMQGDGTYGPNFYPDYKVQYSLDSNPAAGSLITVKQENAAAAMIFAGNTNNAGVKFSLLLNPISTRHVVFLKQSTLANDYTLRVEIYGLPQVCARSFGMVAGSKFRYNPTVSVSSGVIPGDRAKLNSPTAWCASTNDASQYFQYDFGGIRSINGFAIQGHQSEIKWVTNFKVSYRDQIGHSFTTYQESGLDKIFVGCSTNNRAVYHWFSSALRMRHLRIVPLTWNGTICMRMDAFGCPAADCFNELGIQSSSTIPDASLTASTQVRSNEASKGRLNKEMVWEACQTGSCSPMEASGSKPWIQVCLPNLHTVRSVIIQGPGNKENIAVVKEFSLTFKHAGLTRFQSYNIDGTVKKLPVSVGRYTSSQVDLLFPIVSQCVRVQVEAQSTSSSNVGLRWDLLGCNSVPHIVSVTVTPSFPSVAKGGQITLTCTANGYPGASIMWKKGVSALTTGGIYEVGPAFSSNDNVNFQMKMTLKLTPTVSYLSSSFESCSVSDQASGSVECKQRYDCSALYGSVSSSSKSKDVQLTVTGLKAKPVKPGGIRSELLTSNSASISWSPSTPADFPVEKYKALIKRKRDGRVVQENLHLTATITEFTSLAAYTQYMVEVSAVSLTVFSDVGTLEIMTDEGAASAPTAITATVLSATSIKLIWRPPISLNGILHDYKFRFKLVSAANYAAATSAAKQLEVLISGLKPFADYAFQVQATTKVGNILGHWSSARMWKTLQGKPSQPQNLKILARKSRHIEVNWAKPKYENGIIRNYTVGYIGSKRYNASFAHHDQKIVQQNFTLATVSVILDSLFPGTDYKVEIAASTGGGEGNYSSVSTKTLYSAPPPPSLHHINDEYRVISVTLSIAPDLNGPISEYHLYVIEGDGTRCAQNGKVEILSPSKVPLVIQVKPAIKAIEETSLQMGTIGNYSLCYYAVIKDQSKSFISAPVAFTIERLDLEKLDPTRYKWQVNKNSFLIPLAQGPSDTKYYQIIVMESNSTSKDPKDWQPSELRPYDAATYKSGMPYITAVLSFYVSTFAVGDGKDYKISSRIRRNAGIATYVNVPLKENTAYLVFQRAYVSQTVFYSSPWMGPVTTKDATKVKPPVPPNWKMIVGIIAAILIVAILVLGAWYYRRNIFKDENIANKQPVKMSEVANVADNPSYNDDEDETTNVKISPGPAPKAHTKVEKRRSSAASLKQKRIPHAVGQDKRHPAISMQDFAAHSKELQRDSHHGITVEYEDLIKGQQFTWETALSPDNKPRNRYANIAAYDHSRVRLNSVEVAPKSDYYNANYISGYSKNYTYIASQGPVEAGLNDFWRLIWEQHVPAIVMVTNLFERGKIKCAQYWPDAGTARYGEIAVTLVSLENCVDYTIRCLLVTKEPSKESRHMYQFHYITWPDHGIPESPTDLLNLQRKLRKKFPFEMESPILVHCSAGVGRTGTFIVIDAMLELVQSQRKIDVFNYLNFIRTQRIHLVQVEEQYIFIYQAVLEAVTCGMTEIETQNLRIDISKLSKRENGLTGFDRQFQRLTLVTPNFHPRETASALLKTNSSKNRRGSVLPREINRVWLQQSIYENEEGSDFINAVYVNGYKRKNAYIATQHPLAATISDFWLMIYQTNASTFVLLNRLKDGPESLPMFWPAEQEQTMYGGIVVATEQEEVKADSIERNFIVWHKESSDDRRHVKMFHFQSWPDHGVPKDFTKLLLMISKVEKCQQQQTEDEPIVVICKDGAGRCGTFITITIALDRFKTEQLLDVFQTIKKLRAFRPEFVENVVQYKYCHAIAEAYMDSFDTYSNFNG